jgi:hypothetical protein
MGDARKNGNLAEIEHLDNPRHPGGVTWPGRRVVKLTDHEQEPGEGGLQHLLALARALKAQREPEPEPEAEPQPPPVRGSWRRHAVRGLTDGVTHVGRRRRRP